MLLLIVYPTERLSLKVQIYINGCLTSACFLELLEKQVATKLLIDVSIWTQHLPFIYPRVFSLFALNDTTIATQVILDVIVEAILMEISSRLTVN